MTAERRNSLALKALNGDIEGPDGMRHVHDYLGAALVETGIKWTATDELWQLFVVLSAIVGATDPNGDDHFRLELRRVKPGNLKKKQAARHITTNVLAALRVDKLMDEGKSRKDALFEVTKATGVSQNEIYRARRLLEYETMKKLLANKTLKTGNLLQFPGQSE